MLGKMLPPGVIDQMKHGERGKLETFKHITVLFSSIIDFNDLVEKLNATQLITFLNNVFKQFDIILHRYDAYKVESIGDICVITSGM